MMRTLQFNNRFVNELAADPNQENHPRQVYDACYSFVNPTKTSAPELVSYSKEAAALIDLTPSECGSSMFTKVFSGNDQLEAMQPHAMCYGGHQFGNWAGQLGDGRAINLGEARNTRGEHWALQLKGAGPTPYSRSADGYAVLRSSIREYLCSEAMFHLGVPTTRALCVLTTGDRVERDMLYDGNPALEPGAVVCRMAPSFVRFGNFQIFAARDDKDNLTKLTDFTIRHYYPELLSHFDTNSPELVAAFFNEVCQRTVTMIVEWMRVGFVHGVMNTDNMSIHGLTIDYGPYGWLDNFDPQWTPNTTDAGQRRYRYSQQPNVALWNCYQLANALYPLVEETEPLEAALQCFQKMYQEQWQTMMARKLGFSTKDDVNNELFTQLEHLLSAVETDMTRFYRTLCELPSSVQAFKEADVFYQDEVPRTHQLELQTWLDQWLSIRNNSELSESDAKISMRRTNPKYVFRNYLAQQAIEKSEQGDHAMVNELLELFRCPYDEQPQFEHYAAKRPEWARSRVGCSMLSCSS